jgi:Ca-activated chloride channel family protein
MFRFGLDTALYLYLLVPVLLLALWVALRAKRRAMDRFGDSRLLQQLAHGVSRRAQAAKVVLLLATVILLVTALARPQFGTRVETVRREGMDIVVALDLSNSMLAEDITPNRLERAKLAVSQLIDRLEGDRIGLVAFAGEAFVQCPLTVDYAAAKLFLNAMEPDLIPVQGTDLGAALSVALDAFGQESSQYRVLVVITDGEDHEGQIDEATDRAAELGVRAFTVGFGSTEGVPIPEFDSSGRRTGFKRDANGNVITTSLDEATLIQIADRTGGAYYRASARGSELRALADEITSMTGREIEAQQVTQFEEQYQIFLGAALLLLFVEVVVPERRRLASVWKGRFR